MKSVLISIKPKWCELIASGKKMVEVRKTKPKIDTPFKCYIYCTKGKLLTRSNNNGKIYVASSPKYQKALERNGNITLSGKVIGEFVCDEIKEIRADNLVALYFNNPTGNTCLNDLEMRTYANGKNLFLWHISNLVIYDKPRELSEFKKINRDCFLTRPAQSWFYIESEVSE